MGLCGLALSLPEGAEQAAVAALDLALRRWEAAGQGPIGRNGSTSANGNRIVEVLVYPSYLVSLQRVGGGAGPLPALGRAHWSRPCRTWQSVTPIAIAGDGRDLAHASPSARRLAHLAAEKSLRRAVARSVRLADGGSLSPSAVRVQLQLGDVVVDGTVPVGSLPPLQRQQDDLPRRLVHARVWLSVSLRGPLLVGAGRHVGLGMFRPVG